MSSEAIRRIEEELGVKFYPGTELMTDVGSHQFIRSPKSKAVLVPQPSEDPHDPLNWSRPWKLTVMAVATINTIAQGWGPLAIAPQFPALMESFHADLQAVIKFTGVCILILGFSNFFWIPVQATLGRRPVLIISTALCIGCCIWRAVARSYGSYMGACVLSGFAASPAEASQPEVIADVFFLHERGVFNTIFFCFFYGSLMIGPIVAGPMAQTTGWRSFWWLNVAFLGLDLVLLVFLFPETKWVRKRAEQEQTIDIQIPANLNGTDSNSTTSEKPVEVQQDENIEGSATRGQWLGKGRPSRRQYLLFQREPIDWKEMFISFWTPWKLHFYPIVELTAFVVSWSSSCLLTLLLTESQVFSAPPYNYNPAIVGLFNFAILVGAFVGLATNGPLSDYLSMKATIRNKGIREPEMRLPAIIPYLFFLIVGNFVVAFGYTYHWDWRAIVIVGYSFIGVQVASIPSVIVTYAVDCYKPAAGSILVAVTVNKNLWGYGVSAYITEWSMAAGFVKPVLMNMCIVLIWCFCIIPFYFWGKHFRKWTRNSSVHKMI